jgi:hypothetical protein
MICRIHPLTPDHIAKVSALVERDINALLAPPADDQQPGVSSGPTQAERRAELESLFDLARVFAGMGAKPAPVDEKRQAEKKAAALAKRTEKKRLAEIAAKQDAGQQPQG